MELKHGGHGAVVLFARVLGPEANQPTVDCPATVEGLQKRIRKETEKHIDQNNLFQSCLEITKNKSK